MKIDRSRKVGIVSGVGPLAGADVLRRLISVAAKDYGATEDDEYPDIFLVSHGISDVDNLAGLSESFKDGIVGSVKKAELQGANVIGIACNTAHAYLGEIEVSEDTQLLNLLDLVAKKATPGKKYLLLSSRATRDQKLYEPYLKKQNIDFDFADEKQQAELDDVIAKIMSYHLDEAAQKLSSIIYDARELYDGIIEGCTELPIVVKQDLLSTDIELIQSNEVLARELVRACYR